MITNGLLFERIALVAAKTQALAAQLKTLKRAEPRPDTGVIICNVRDEINHLPHFLAHYRNIGARRFAFVDNGSIDDTVSFLLDQADCDVFQFLSSYREAASGALWKNVMISAYRASAWVLSVDADEHAVYDGWPDLSLDGFAAALNRRGLGVVTAIMVDMYGSGAVRHTHVTKGGSLLQASPLFDGDGYTIALPENWRKDNFPRLSIQGGPVMRLFGTDQLGWLSKTPLILQPNILFLDPHTVYPAALNFAKPGIALLHFRFLASLVEKIARIAERKLYSSGSLRNYERIGAMLQANPAFSFVYPGSQHFDGPHQLVERGLITPRPGAAG